MHWSELSTTDIWCTRKPINAKIWCAVNLYIKFTSHHGCTVNISVHADIAGSPSLPSISLWLNLSLDSLYSFSILELCLRTCARSVYYDILSDNRGMTLDSFTYLNWLRGLKWDGNGVVPSVAGLIRWRLSRKGNWCCLRGLSLFTGEENGSVSRMQHGKEESRLLSSIGTDEKRTVCRNWQSSTLIEDIDAWKRCGIAVTRTSSWSFCTNLSSSCFGLWEVRPLRMRWKLSTLGAKWKWRGLDERLLKFKGVLILRKIQNLKNIFWKFVA